MVCKNVQFENTGHPSILIGVIDYTTLLYFTVLRSYTRL
jgi:hypothetical protein